MFHFAISVCDRPAVTEPAVSGTGSGAGNVLPFSIPAELVSTSISLCISICDSERMESEAVASTPFKASTSRSATGLTPSELNSSHSR